MSAPRFWCLHPAARTSRTSYATAAERDAADAGEVAKWQGSTSAASHGYASDSLWDAIRKEGGTIEVDPVGKAADGKPIGHSTHNLFVKDKKSKAHYLITARQACKPDLKAIAKAIGAKELRLASDKEAVLETTKGCITCLSLFFDGAKKVQWVVDKALEATPAWCLCAGCSDPLNHAQHNVTTVAFPAGVKALLPHHFETRQSVDMGGGSGDAPAPTALAAPAALSGASAANIPAGEKATATLGELNLAYTAFSHPASPTIEAWQPHCAKYAPAAKICKNLFLKDKKKKTFVLVSALADTATRNLKPIEEQLKVKNLRLADPALLMEKLGLKSGAVTPLSCLVDEKKEITFVLDKDMIEAGKTAPLIFHPLSGNDASLTLGTDALLAYFKHAGVTPNIITFPPAPQ